MAETLLPCPFCGGVAGVDKTNYYFEDTGEHAMSAFVVSCRLEPPRGADVPLRRRRDKRRMQRVPRVARPRVLVLPQLRSEGGERMSAVEYTRCDDGDDAAAWIRLADLIEPDGADPGPRDLARAWGWK